MSKLSPETLQEMADMRREASEDLTDLIFLINLASANINALGEKFTYLGSELHDLKTAIRIAKEKAEISRDYHNTEAFQFEGEAKKALKNLQATGPLLQEQEK